MAGEAVPSPMESPCDPADVETVTTERARTGRSVLGDDAIPDDVRTTLLDSRTDAEIVQPSAATDEAAVERFLADTDFDRSFVVVLEVPASRSNCYALSVESVTATDEGVAVEATVDRERPECLDAPTVLTGFVRVGRDESPTTISVELHGDH